ncbi:unnamed protein product [Rhizoctonia solani]|uniref:Uncharacterized protein n=1 Tax=Rhizoctonia solani TaxID=456999 RepID=A0A8H3HEJ5_9AGAM|nr:unnamed protein product [Rhizoctonia solani]
MTLTTNVGRLRARYEDLVRLIEGYLTSQTQSTDNSLKSGHHAENIKRNPPITATRSTHTRRSNRPSPGGEDKDEDEEEGEDKDEEEEGEEGKEDRVDGDEGENEAEGDDGDLGNGDLGNANADGLDGDGETGVDDDADERAGSVVANLLANDRCCLHADLDLPQVYKFAKVEDFS